MLPSTTLLSPLQGSIRFSHAQILRPCARARFRPFVVAVKETKGPQPTITDPVQTVVYGGTLPSRRRLLGGTGTAALIALGGNLGGVTSSILALDGGKAAGVLRLDVLLPVNGLKRCVDYTHGYEFVYPSSWLADQTILYRATERAEASRGLDPPPARPAQRPSPNVVEPVAAFGPPGTSGEQNISVVVAPIMGGFRLDSLGPPAAAAQRFLDTTVAPPGSPLTATLVNAYARCDASGQLYYAQEFTVKGPRFSRHNVSVYTTRDSTLYTYNAQCPEDLWEDAAALLRRSAESFVLQPAPGIASGPPSPLPAACRE